jgi:hypothetical protein
MSRRPGYEQAGGTLWRPNVCSLVSLKLNSVADAFADTPLFWGRVRNLAEGSM